MSESESAKIAAAEWVRERMDLYGLTLDDLIEAGCFTEPEPEPEPAAVPAAKAKAEKNGKTEPAEAPAKTRTVLYRNALGQSWDGTGEYPDWLQRAVNAGQSIEFFRVE